MNDYGFNYLNYITNVPSNMNYGNIQNGSINPMNVVSGQGINMNYEGMKENMNILDPYQGFIRGNMFSSLYDEYMNYRPGIVNSNDEKTALLYQIMQYKFALVDLHLYLDTHPNDSNVLELYRKYLSIEKQMCDKYESMYGPLTLDSNYINNNSWNWINRPWPWEVK